MRALRVLGLVDGIPGASRNLLLEDPSTGEQFSTRCDDRLIAATRGDLSRFGQSETELESQLRPKEIQARIRAGASVEQLAALAGTSRSRVERFAYPVLLERANVVEKACKARPAIDGITGSASVAETVAATLAARGHDDSINWDAYKDDDGWVLTLTWTAGRSENQAHWLYHPGPDGGTLSARDEAAAEIVDPALRILRPLRQVRPEKTAAALLDPTAPTEAHRPAETPHRQTEAASRSAHPAGGKLRSPVRVGDGLPTRSTSGSTPFGRQPLPTSFTGSAASAERVAEPVLAEPVLAEPVLAESLLAAPQLASPAFPDRITEDLLRDDRAGVHPVLPVDSVRTGTEPVTHVLLPGPGGGSAAPSVGAVPSRPGTPAASRASGVVPGTARAAKRGNRPAMPSWEDVLLGTRSDKAAGR